MCLCRNGSSSFSIIFAIGESNELLRKDVAWSAGWLGLWMLMIFPVFQMPGMVELAKDRFMMAVR